MLQTESQFARKTILTFNSIRRRSPIDYFKRGKWEQTKWRLNGTREEVHKIYFKIV